MRILVESIFENGESGDLAELSSIIDSMDSGIAYTEMLRIKLSILTGEGMTDACERLAQSEGFNIGYLVILLYDVQKQRVRAGEIAEFILDWVSVSDPDLAKLDECLYENTSDESRSQLTFLGVMLNLNYYMNSEPKFMEKLIPCMMNVIENNMDKVQAFATLDEAQWFMKFLWNEGQELQDDPLSASL